MTTITGGAGNDTLRGTAAFNELRGLGGDDILIAFGTGDSLYGGDGNDTLVAAGDRNTNMWGGAGADVFRIPFVDITTGTRNFINDFNRAEGDKIDITAFTAIRNFDDVQKVLTATPLIYVLTANNGIYTPVALQGSDFIYYTPPSVAIGPATVSQQEGNSGLTDFTFTLTRTGDTAVPVSVNWSVANGTTNNADFAGGTLPSGQVSFAAGETSKTLTVQVAGDAFNEANETFEVVLGSTSNGNLGNTRATGIILNDDPLPQFSIAIQGSASQLEGNSGTTPFTFTVTRAGDTSNASTVDWSVQGTSVTAGDFTGGVLPSGSLSFVAGETSKTISVPVAGDTIREANESFQVVLSNANGATISVSSAQGTILNDDPLPVLNLALSGAGSKSEADAGTDGFTFTITRTGDTSAASTVNWSLQGVSTGLEANDLAGGLAGGQVTFAAGETVQTIVVKAIDDARFEADETFQVVLSNASGATLGTSSVEATLVNDDPLPTLSVAFESGPATEGTGTGGTPYLFTITRSGDVSGASSVSYAVQGGTATANDFVGGVLPAGSVSFAAGETSKTIAIDVNGDVTFEADETFQLVLFNASGATIANGSTGDIVIVNDDALPIVSIVPTDAQVTEGDSGITLYSFTVTRTGADTSMTTVVDWAVAGGDMDAADFAGGVLPAGQITFAPGETSKIISVPISGDTRFEANETLQVQLTGITGATGGTLTAQTTILNDDPLPVISAATESISGLEGNADTTALTFVLTRTGDLTLESSVDWTVNGNTATANDFVGGVLPSGRITFAAGETEKTITVNVAGDTRYEADETFSLTLSNASGATLGNAVTQGTILNDDAAPVVSVAIDGAASLTEAAAADQGFSFTITRSGESDLTSTVNWSLRAASAGLQGDDIAGGLVSGQLTFAAGQTTQTVVVKAFDDAHFEGDDRFEFVLSDASGATLGTTTAQATILNDDPLPTVSLAGDVVRQLEGDSGTTLYSFTLIRSGDLSLQSTVDWSVQHGTTNNADFLNSLLPSGQIIFAAGEAEKTITVEVAGDRLYEWDETFDVVLNAASGATLGTSRAQAVILNDDPLPTVSVTANVAQQPEGDSGVTAFNFTLTRTGDLSVASVVNWSVQNGTTTAADFAGGVLPFGQVTFAAGEAQKNITINVAGDTIREADETFRLVLETATNAVIGTAMAQATILNDDPLPQLSVALQGPASRAEGNSGTTPFTFTVTRSGDVSAASTVQWAVQAAAVTASDFAGNVVPSGVLEFAAGETSKTITVQVTGDTAVESDETFQLVLANATGATLGTATAQATILNDDLAGPETTLIGTARNDILHASTGNALIKGLGGNDVIWASGGGNTLEGGDGNDILVVINGDGRQNVILGGSGNDTIMSSAGNDFIDAGDGNDIVLQSAGNDSVLGGRGNDQLWGGAGNDTVRGEDGNDSLYGEADDDLLDGGQGNDRLEGGTGNDILIGVEGNDTLLGGSGSDRLNGGAGRDVLTGGAGADIFVWDFAGISGSMSARDVITDFSQVEGDKLDLSAFAGLRFAGTSFAPAGMGSVISIVQGKQTLVNIDLNGDRIADGGFVLEGVYKLTASDFLFG
jgi:Ca2+-binding RTX toxin-like protein